MCEVDPLSDPELFEDLGGRWSDQPRSVLCQFVIAVY